MRLNTSDQLIRFSNRGRVEPTVRVDIGFRKSDHFGRFYYRERTEHEIGEWLGLKRRKRHTLNR